MATTLTREKLLNKVKTRYEEKEIPGFGVVGIRSVSILKRSHRSGRLFDEDGNLKEVEFDRRNIYSIIDQVMVDESTPMFTEADVDLLSGMDGALIDPLLAAIREFNSDEEEEVVEKKDKSAESSQS